jgi:branched-chain amino acid transport system substrate-binding protein
VLGAYQDDNAIIFGAILPTVIPQPPPHFATLEKTGASMRAGLALAVDDFASDRNPSHGIPPAPGGTAARPIVVVVCSDGHNATSTANATTHLASTVGVPAIIGTAFGTFTRQIVTTLATIGKSDVLLLTPRSTDLVAADNGGLFERLAPADDVQGNALSGLFANREPIIRSGLSDGGAATLKVALVYKEDAYGNSTAASVKSSLKFNGIPATSNGANFREIKYGNPDLADYSPSQLDSATFGIVNARPHAIIFVGTNEVVKILAGVESGWQEGSYRPRYLFSDGAAVPELVQFLVNTDTSDLVRKRILGTMTTGNSARFNAFASAFSAKFPQQPSTVYGAAGAYDAVYLLAYSATAVGAKAINGPDLLDGFGLLAPGGGALTVGVGPDNITSAFSTLGGGQQINLDGASSPLDFNATTHATLTTETQVWCLPSVSGKAQDPILSGMTIDNNNVAQGVLAGACGQ